MRCFFFSSRRRHTRLQGDWSSDVCSSDLYAAPLELRTGRDCPSGTERDSCTFLNTNFSVKGKMRAARANVRVAIQLVSHCLYNIISFPDESALAMSVAELAP